jgi:hypothetical protein
MAKMIDDNNLWIACIKRLLYIWHWKNNYDIRPFYHSIGLWAINYKTVYSVYFYFLYQYSFVNHFLCYGYERENVKTGICINIYMLHLNYICSIIIKQCLMCTIFNDEIVTQGAKIRKFSCSFLNLKNLQKNAKSTSTC